MKKKIKLDTFMKLITAISVGHGMILTTLSYILAFMGRETVADVSTVIVQEITAPVITYMAMNTIMNIFEKNIMSFSIPKEYSDIFIKKNKKYDHIKGENNDYQ